MTTTTVDPNQAFAFLDEYTGIAVPIIVLGIAFISLIAMQIIFALKTDNLLVWLAPIFLGVAGGFSCLATMSYYSSFEEIANSWIEGLTKDGQLDILNQLQTVCPNFGAYSVTFLFLAILFFLSIFVSFVLAVIKAVKRRNTY